MLKANIYFHIAQIVFDFYTEFYYKRQIDMNIVHVKNMLYKFINIYLSGMYFTFRPNSFYITINIIIISGIYAFVAHHIF